MANILSSETDVGSTKLPNLSNERIFIESPSVVCREILRTVVLSPNVSESISCCPVIWVNFSPQIFLKMVSNMNGVSMNKNMKGKCYGLKGPLLTLILNKSSSST